MISQLFLKAFESDTVSTRGLTVDTKGVVGGKPQHPWKQLLLLPRQTLDQFDLSPGQLNEDLIIDSDINLHDLPSGTSLQLGSAIVRLTFHCEPCHKIKHLIRPNKLLHHRGYHSQVLTPGTIKNGDTITVLPQKHEAIPYRLSDRIQWYLERNPTPILVKDLVAEIGFSSSYCRAVPNSIKHRDDIDKSLILYQNRQR